MSTDRLKISWYALTILVSSGLLLVLEVVAGRLIAPYVGVSLYTWTAVIGVILAGLSAGNWIGGVWADAGAGEKASGVVLVGASLTTLAIPLILTLVAPGIQDSAISLLSASLLLVLSLFFVPALLLGIITPLLTTLALGLSSRTGHIVGMMHALAAIGSIGGTFLTGYWLIQAFGSRAVVLGTAFTLGVISLPFFKRSGTPRVAAVVLVAAGVLVGVTSFKNGYATPCDRESSYFCIRVVSDDWEVPPGELRSLVLDHLLHGSNHSTEARVLAAPYVHLMDELVLDHFGAAARPDFFFIGGGAYTQPRAVLALYPGASVTVAELDPLVTATARDMLFVETDTIEIHHSDARAVLARDRKRRYDVIVADAFHDIAVPIHLVTREFAQLVRARLNPGGLYTLNVVDAFPDAKLVKSMVKTLRGVFSGVHVWLEGVPEDQARVTYVISAGDGYRPAETLVAQRGIQRQWFDVTGPLLSVGTPVDSLPVLTDDRAPVEELMASLFLTRLGR